MSLEKSPNQDRFEVFNLPTRNQFGPGILGQKVFDLIACGNHCERIITNPDGQSVICGKPAVGSLDFDVGGIGDVVLVCSEACFRKTAEDIIRETNTQGRPTAIGRNGFGRA